MTWFGQQVTEFQKQGTRSFGTSHRVLQAIGEPSAAHPLDTWCPQCPNAHIHCFLITVTKMPGGSSFQKEARFTRAHRLRMESILEGKTQQQESEAAGHVASTVWKQRAVSAGWCSALFFLFYL